ncbi:prepilin-type N-terminal cleavage/methylation domain-containing protein [Candidatus Saccharibacteria bacterium]|nr:prepilin-type N-terminal cleavage/methylation domain-containing protein [Candidatus Saccharibacteria bacterium]
MTKSLTKLQKGFTIIELLIVIAIIAILAGLVLNNFQGAQAKARDTQRVTRINAIHSKLEEFYNEANGYPADAANTANFPGIDQNAVKDPRGGDLVSTIVADATAMAAAADPTSGSGNEFKYVTYPTGCDMALSGGSYSGTACTGYRLMTYVERPTTTTPNPYVKLGLQNP